MPHTGQRRVHVGSALPAANEKTPSDVESWVFSELKPRRFQAPASANFPFSAFLNRDAFPFLRISRAIAEYTAETMLPRSCGRWIS